MPYVRGAEGDAIAQKALRRVDPCALLDPDAAKHAIEGTPDQLLPGPSLAECTLDILPPGAKHAFDAWTLSIEVGVLFDRETDIDELGATPQPIAGATAQTTTFYRERSLGDDSCSIVRPVDVDYGVQLEARAPGLGQTPKQPPCDAAVRYIERTVDRWQTFPQRRDGLTLPTLPLADRDPCAATHDIGKRLDMAVLARPTDPYTCQIAGKDTTSGPSTDTTGTTGTPGATVSQPDADSDVELLRITFGFLVDPASREPTPDGPEPVTVDRHPGTRADGNGDKSCSVAVAVNDTLVVDTEDGGRVQVVTVTAATCDHATQAAAAVLADVTRR